MTYNNCKKLYELKKNNGELTEAFISHHLECLDIFLMNERISKNEYNELASLLNRSSNG